MDLIHEKGTLWPGTAGPVVGTPRRAPGSVRRTTTIDIGYEDNDDVLILRGRGRDLLTPVVGRARTIHRGAFDARVDVVQRTILEIKVEPDRWQPEMAEFTGLSARSGFRRALAERIPELVQSGSVLAQLLDDVPVTTLISAASLYRRGAVPPSAPWTTSKVGVCAGWVAGGVMDTAIKRSGKRHLVEGPEVHSLAASRDRSAWHRLEPLSPGSMRRHRRMDVRTSNVGGLELDAILRDVYVEQDGRQTAIHEYVMDLDADVNGLVRHVHTVAGVLPGPQCPNAVGSAQRIVGTAIADIRSFVDRTFSGTSTCTHLNDALRSLGDALLLWQTLLPS